MSFWAFIGILLILAVMVGALYLSKIAVTREQNEMDKRKRIRTLRNDLIDTDELIHTLLVYDRNPDLLTLLSEKMSKIIHDGMALLPNNEDLMKDLADLEKTNHAIQSLRENPQEPEIPSSDRQIFLIKKNFIRTIKLLKSIQSEGDINELDMSTHRARLMKNSLMLEVKAYSKQGKDAKAQGEISSAANFFKHAKELLIHSDVSFPEKTQYIKETSREISNLYVTLPDQKETDS